MPTPLIILCAVLLFFILLLALRLRVVITATGGSLAVELRVLFLRFRLYPRRRSQKPQSVRKARQAERKKAKKAAKKAAKQQRKAKKKKEQAKEKPRTVRQKIRFARALVAALLRRTHKHLRLHAARLHIRVAAGDAATTAIAYGAVSQSVSYLLCALDKITRLKAAEPDVAVEPDFTAERSDIDLHLILSIRLIGVLACALGTAFALLRGKLERAPKRKKKQVRQNALRKKGT